MKSLRAESSSVALPGGIHVARKKCSRRGLSGPAFEYGQSLVLNTQPLGGFTIEPGAEGTAKRLIWSWDSHGVPTMAEHDPGVRGSRWLEFEVLRLLPIQGLL